MARFTYSGFAGLNVVIRVYDVDAETYLNNGTGAFETPYNAVNHNAAMTEGSSDLAGLYEIDTIAIAGPRKLRATFHNADDSNALLGVAQGRVVGDDFVGKCDNKDGETIRSDEILNYTLNAGNTGWITIDEPTGVLSDDGALTGCLLRITDISTGHVEYRYAVSHFISGGDAGFNPDVAFSFTPVAGDTLEVFTNTRGFSRVASTENNALTASSLSSNTITAAKIATDAIGSAQLAASAVTEIQAGLATEANVTAVGNAVLTRAEPGDEMGLTDGAITDDKFTIPTLTGPATGVVGMIAQTWRRWFKRSTLTATQLKTFADDGTTVVTTQSALDDGTTQDLGSAT